MVSNGKDDDLQMGFVTAIELPGAAFVGGLLVTNRYGRPLEFQCTTPVKPNKTQEILYGPTLMPFLLGELIAATLIEKVSIKPHFVLTEQEDMLEVRNHVAAPVACLLDDSEDPPNSQEARKAERVGRQRLFFHTAHKNDQSFIEKNAHLIPDDADLREPFERVREALGEATRSQTGR